MQNSTDTKIQEYLQKISSDEAFAKSPRYTKVLSYLVEQALAGNDLKEHIIGMDLFEQNYNADKNDGIVRVYMYNLRKKLKAYYSAAGKEDTVVFVLEKGTYNLKFVTNKDTDIQPAVQSKQPIIKKGIIAVLIALVVIFFSVNYFQSKNNKLYCWEAFFQKHSTTTCVLADQVVMAKKGNPPGHLITKNEVNSSSDFISYTKKNDIDSLLLMDYSFYTKAIPYSLIDLSRWFFEHNKEFTPVPESEFRYEETRRGNIVYIGQYKTMSVSKELFLKNSKVFSAELPGFISTRNGEPKQYKTQYTKDGVRTEYAMVSYMPLSDGNKALYFVSNHDIGTMATLHKFIDPIFLEEFYKNLPSTDSYFNALFKAEGVERTDISCVLVELEIVEL